MKKTKKEKTLVGVFREEETGGQEAVEEAWKEMINARPLAPSPLCFTAILSVNRVVDEPKTTIYAVTVGCRHFLAMTKEGIFAELGRLWDMHVEGRGEAGEDGDEVPCTAPMVRP